MSVLEQGLLEMEIMAPKIDPIAVKNLKQETKTTKNEPHKFWDTQPVPRLADEVTEENGPIELPLPLDQVQKEPMALIAALEWSYLDVTNADQLSELYVLLRDNYVEDSDCMFRFDYSREFLQWALMPPGFRTDWHLGIRQKSTKKLLAFISAIPGVVKVYDKTVKLVEINYLCVSKALRSLNLAPVLIQEITRLVHLTDVWQAVYTAGRLLPRPVTIARYYHRPINPKKLIEVGFSSLGPRMTMSRLLKLHTIASETTIPGLRPFEEKDVPAVTDLLRRYLSRFHLSPMFFQEEVRHWLLPREGVIYTYIVEDPVSHEITDMFSFYSLPSSILKNPKHNVLNAAYSFYNVSTKTPWLTLIENAVIVAKQRDFDVFNALDIMENHEFISNHKFGVGDGKLHYYLYNWCCPTMIARNMGLVLM